MEQRPPAISVGGLVKIHTWLVWSFTQMIEVKRTGTRLCNFWQPYLKTNSKWGCCSLLYEFRYMVKLVKPIGPGSDMSVTRQYNSWCKLGAHTTKTICNHTFGLSNPELSHTWAVNAALAEISAPSQTLPSLSLVEAVHHLHPPRVLQLHLLLTHSMQQSGLWAWLELLAEGDSPRDFHIIMALHEWLQRDIQILSSGD